MCKIYFQRDGKTQITKVDHVHKKINILVAYDIIPNNLYIKASFKFMFESLISHLDHSNDQKSSAMEFSITGVGLLKTKEICNRDFVGMFPE